MLLRRYRPARRARHASVGGAGVAWRRALRAAVSAAGGAPDRLAAFRRAGDPRRAAASPARIAVRGADDADAAGAAPEVAGADLANLKTIYYGGGPMYVADLEKALGLFGPRLYQLFGQGESPMTITGLNQRLHADSTHPRWHERLGSCGVARTGVLVRVVDEDDREVPPG